MREMRDRTMAKRIIAMLLLFCICISLCACGASSDKSAAENDQSAALEETADALSEEEHEEPEQYILIKSEDHYSSNDYSYNETSEYQYDEQGVLLGYLTFHESSTWNYTEETVVTFEEDGTKVEDTTRIDSGYGYREKTVTNASGNEILYQSFGYDGQVSSFRETVYDDKTGLELSYTAKYNIGSDEYESCYHYEYEYDANGNIVKQLECEEEGSVEEYTLYFYNDLNEIVSEDSYNAKDQLTEHTEYAENGSKTYDAEDHLLRYTEDEKDENGNLVRSLQYDAEGTIQGTSLREYDEANTLRKVSYTGEAYSFTREYNEYGDLVKYEYDSEEYTTIENCTYTYVTVQEYLSRREQKAAAADQEKEEYAGEYELLNSILLTQQKYSWSTWYSSDTLNLVAEDEHWSIKHEGDKTIICLTASRNNPFSANMEVRLWNGYRVLCYDGYVYLPKGQAQAFIKDTFTEEVLSPEVSYDILGNTSAFAWLGEKDTDIAVEYYYVQKSLLSDKLVYIGAILNNTYDISCYNGGTSTSFELGSPFEVYGTSFPLQGVYVGSRDGFWKWFFDGKRSEDSVPDEYGMLYFMPREEVESVALEKDGTTFFRVVTLKNGIEMKFLFFTFFESHDGKECYIRLADYINPDEFDFF